MINAEMCNKIPQLENWEDILTSNVFGLLELIDYKYLLEIIKHAKLGTNYTYNLVDQFSGRQIKSLKLWHRFGKDEPDIYITLDDGTSFVIEVKYYSGEHNKKKKTNDDKKEYEEGQLKKYLQTTKINYIVYLTASYRSLKELSDDSKTCLDKIYHMHWKDFNKHLKEVLKRNSDGKCETNVIMKISEYLDFKGFDHWHGFEVNYAEIDTNTGGFYGKK